MNWGSWEGIILNLKEYLNFASLCKLNRTSTSFKTNRIVLQKIAIKVIEKWWWIKKTEMWINYCLSTVLHKHTFCNRTEIYGLPNFTHFVGAIYAIDFHRKKKKHIYLKNYLFCACGNELEVAVYYSIGDKMLRSFPVCSFSCEDCLNSEERLYDFHVNDFYQDPVYLRYYKYKDLEWSHFDTF